MRVLHPKTNVVVITEPRISAWLGLMVCCVIISAFYYTFTVAGDASLASTADDQTGPYSWSGSVVFLLLPVLLAPYVFRCLRAVTTGDTITFDGDAGMVTKNGRRVAAFADIQNLRLKPVNGTCEELALHAELTGGGEITVYTGAAASRVFGLADEIGALLNRGRYPD